MSSSLFGLLWGILDNKIAWRRILKVRDVIKIVEGDGWCHVKTVGDHRQYKHPTKMTKVTIAGHPSDEMKPKTYAHVLQQAQIDRKQVRRKR
ncbi:MAG TPA: type II toxin-antitoxin system HicA family toxin [Ktedonobacteraceae bacterium]|jgi:predicted RNA binding protein YcfA (HicA-like mRNA interferase family)